ncbi:MAG: hypothetical protein N3D20_01605 [Candidatus Pacearchaeota archaeon]|nr:hypothetical protein [Candidatus Pacearchaeota archaeon]
MAEENSVMVVAVLAVIASLAAAGISYYSAISVVPKIVGYQVYGSTNLTVESFAMINFTDSSVNWGSGKVNIGKTKAYLDTRSGTVTDGNWTAETTGLMLENLGNVNVTLNLSAGKTAAQFIGGTNPAYKWWIRDNETGSCINVTGPSNGFGGWADPSTTSITICNPLRFLIASNEIRIDFNVTVPEDATKGARSDTITAIGIATT